MFIQGEFLNFKNQNIFTNKKLGTQAIIYNPRRSLQIFQMHYTQEYQQPLWPRKLHKGNTSHLQKYF